MSNGTRKSAYGTKTMFLWEGCVPLSATMLTPTKSMHTISREQEQRIVAKREELLRSHRSYDSQLWRYERSSYDGRSLSIEVSPTTYSAHAALKQEEGLPWHSYPNPIGINTIQETSDGYILVGTRAIWTQLGDALHLIGCGYLNRENDHTITDTIRRECGEETSYTGAPPTLEHAASLALLFGQNHDTGLTVHVPLQQTRTEVGLNGEEHSNLLFIPNTQQAIDAVLVEGSFQGIRCLDQMLGSLEAYNIQRARLLDRTPRS